ncbi:MAG: hypothetical protein EBT21_00615, partial [Actinobacteria bacterium]|nr:hypothetical protein [Actinomycetota bacterium]
NNCGTLDDALVAGKTYILSFWAKGSGYIAVTFDELGGSGTGHDFVDPTNENVGNDGILLEGGWHEYTIGPLDTSSFASFDDSAIIDFGAPAGSIFYLDNIRLKAVEENVTVIKDSWVTPSTCDQTADGADSPQYYLGCEAYTDQNGNTADLYQFSDLCSEDVVGCEAVYDTQNSDGAFGTVYNARCSNDAGVVSANTACLVSGDTACTISAGESYCLFDYDGSTPVDMPTDGTFSMQLGPEARAVETDMPAYLVDDGSARCTAENVGCTEVGFPTYDQDKSNVASFESTYVIDDPDSYSDILCENQALFCEEWSSTQDGNYYFKDPADQTCEYQSGVTINGMSYSGWFRKDTDEPCYWTDTDASGDFDPSADDSYLISGSSFGVWRNGDTTFTGWGATCPNSEDLCTEFTDESDTDQGVYPAGTPYYFLDDSTLSEESLTASEQCQGQVSQKAGCALFYDTSDSTLSYNTTASYIASTHADDIFGDEPGSKQDPISCEDPDNAVITTPSGETVNLCEKRCYYQVDDGDSIDTPSAQSIYVRGMSSSYDDQDWLDGSCYADTDCPDLDTVNGTTVSGSCVMPDDDLNVVPRLAGTAYPYALSNDANRVIKVDRDRECAAWLSCQSSQVSWNSRTSKFETICDKVGLCTRYTRTGDTSFCTQWSETDPVVLDASEYASRDTTWNGIEYAGYAIPNQLPVDQYDQVNIAPDESGYICVEGTDTDGDGVADTTNSPVIPQLAADGSFHPCDDASDSGSDCDDATYVCRTPVQDFRLGYVAGSCDLSTDGWLGECIVGHCETSGDACSTDGDCDGSEQCVVGYCQYVDPSVTDPCSEATEATVCVNATYPICDVGISRCVNDLAPNASTCVDAGDCAAYSGGQCTKDAASKVGSCLNNTCVTDIGGDPLDRPTNAENESCRGYPEVLAPFPNEVVTEWKSPTGDVQTAPEDFESRPYTFAYGFETVNACSPIDNLSTSALDASATGDCDCSYDKVQYGATGAVTRYYPLSTDLSVYGANTGVCIGGALAGTFCSDDSECSTSGSYAGGTCATLARQDAVYGWDGYCLERDTSIQKNGSSADEDRACLTWLPVDQLSGSTDLYGKFVGAGFNQGDTYYCSETDAAYYFQATDASFDAGAFDDTCGNDPPNTCIDGSFMVVWSCEERDIGYGDYHYYNALCVPNDSFQADADGVIDYTKPCENNGGSDNIDHVDAADAAAYETCRTPIAASVSELSDYVDPAEYYDSANLATDITLHTQAVCSQVVKVADSSVYNTGWTDRLYDHVATTDYTIVTYDADMAYAVNSKQDPFGKADDVSESSPIDTDSSDDSHPLKVVACEEGTAAADAKEFPTAGPTCDTGFSLSSAGADGEDARAYTSFTWYATGDSYHDGQIMDGTGYDAADTCTTDSDCAAMQTICAASGYCQNISCSTSETSLADNGCNIGVECSDGTCNLGPREGRACVDDRDCQVLLCRDTGGPATAHYSVGANFCKFAYPVAVSNGTASNAAELIKQIFAKSLTLTSTNPTPWWRYSMATSFPASTVSSGTDYGGYEQQSSTDTDLVSWDYTATGDTFGGYDTEGNVTSEGIPSVPIIRSVGECDGTNCEEGDEGRFSVNGVDSGDIEGADGYKHISVSFFAYANPNQMPIKNIIVDWGDGNHADTSHDWPVGGVNGSQSGSTSSDNFYQNHRGYDSVGDPMCGSEDNWSMSPDACDESYITFSKDYVCETGMIDDLPECETTTDPDGNTRLTNSPCAGNGTIGSAGSCVFQPRVSVKDNWGWCTGYCDAEDALGYTSSDTAGLCYSGLHGNECNTSHCPSTSDGSCPDYTQGGIVNPWINYDGYVVVTP